MPTTTKKAFWRSICISLTLVLGGSPAVPVDGYSADFALFRTNFESTADNSLKFRLSTQNVNADANFKGKIEIRIIPEDEDNGKKGKGKDKDKGKGKQSIEYSLRPASVDFVDISINSKAKKIVLSSNGDKTGRQVFDVIASNKDGDEYKVRLTVVVGRSGGDGDEDEREEEEEENDDEDNDDEEANDADDEEDKDEDKGDKKKDDGKDNNNNEDSKNSPPRITSSPAKTASVEKKYEYKITATDPDKDKIIIKATRIPRWLSLQDSGDGTAVLSGTPSQNNLGEQQVAIEVSDLHQASTRQSFIIRVTGESENKTDNIEEEKEEEPAADNNSMPFFTSEPLEVAAETYLYFYTITADDEDLEDALTIEAVNLPDWLSLTEKKGKTAVLSGRPLQGDAGDYEIVLEVSDSKGGVAKQTFVLHVLPLNQAIQLNIEPEDLHYGFDGDRILLTSYAEIYYFQGEYLTGATISIAENYAPGTDSLSATLPDGITAVFNHGELYLEGKAPVDIYEEILTTIYYHSNTNPESGNEKTIRFQVNDVNLTSNAVTKKLVFEEVEALDIPNGITPNDDGDNDHWIITNIAAETPVEIYTRSGNKVFESEDYYQNQMSGKAWDGTDNEGNELPPGVYFYIIDFKKLGVSYKGTVSILK